MTDGTPQGTTTSPTWTLPLFLASSAWAGMPFDELTEQLSSSGDAHLLEVVGDDVAPLTDADPAAGPSSLLPALLQMLRSDHGEHAAEVLSLITASPGDLSSVPPVPGVREDVTAAGCGTLVRDPASSVGIFLTTLALPGGVRRWRARGIAECPVAPQPAGPGAAMAELDEAVMEAASLIERAAAGAAAQAPGPVQVEVDPVRLPPGLDTRALRILDRAERVEAIAATALANPGVGHVGYEREPVVRRLVSAVDAARRAGVAAAGEAAVRSRRPESAVTRTGRH